VEKVPWKDSYFAGRPPRIGGIVPCSIINSKQLSSEQAFAPDELIEIVGS